jgi:hypothetical protein
MTHGGYQIRRCAAKKDWWEETEAKEPLEAFCRVLSATRQQKLS